MKESLVRNPPSGDQREILKADPIMQKLKNNAMRDLREKMDFDYMEIPVANHEPNVELGVHVWVHECDDEDVIFVSAVQKMNFMKENSLPWRNWSQVKFIFYSTYISTETS